ncbi:TRAP transporter large permease [Radicibacter daui]|uniref:TRAP transporter large permease n=1 Tax=Radicibacter daui TaxID=3064829 RepID=UPI004046AE68
MSFIAFLALILLLGILLAAGFWIGLAMLLSGIAGLLMFGAPNVTGLASSTVFAAINSWPLTALPLFLLMGEILSRSRLSEDLFRGLSPLVRWLPGGLLHVNILGCGLLAAIVGSSGVCSATVGRMSLPELKRRGYDESLSIGTLTGSGTLGLLIPPSIMMIVYGTVGQVSISRLFLAGVLPGLIMMLLFMAYVAGRSLLAGRGQAPKVKDEPTSWRDLRRVVPPIALILLVIGSIYAGFATPTESAAIGVAGAVALAATGRTLTARMLTGSLMAAVRSTALIMLIIAGAAVLSAALDYAQIPRAAAELVAEMQLGPAALLLALTILYLILGCFLEGASMIVLTAAVVLPMVKAVGIDTVWFGIFVVIMVELAQITPPVGFNLFILQAMTGRDIGVVTRASMPFFFVMLLSVALFAAFPQLVLFLPEQMIGR